MRGLLLLFLAATASAQDSRGFVNQDLVTRNVFQDALKAQPPQQAVIEDSTAMDKLKQAVLETRSKLKRTIESCAVPLLEAKIDKFVSGMPVLKPDTNTDPKMILPTIPVCGKDTK